MGHGPSSPPRADPPSFAEVETGWPWRATEGENTNWKIVVKSDSCAPGDRQLSQDLVLWTLGQSGKPMATNEIVDLVQGLDEATACLAKSVVCRRVAGKLDRLRVKGLVTKTGVGRDGLWSLTAPADSGPPVSLREMTDDAWLGLVPLLPPTSVLFRQISDTRRFVTVVANVAMADCKWSAPPRELGFSDFYRNRFRAWARLGVWAKMAPYLAMTYGETCALRLAAEEQATIARTHARGLTGVVPRLN